MNDSTSNRMTRLCGLWQKTSAKGNTYLLGRLGDVNVLIFEQWDAAEGQPTHIAFVAPRAQQQRDEDA